MLKWLHKLMNPHCNYCEAERACKQCDTLLMIIEARDKEIKQLLDAVLRKDEVKVEQVDTTEFQPIQSKNVPWRVRREALEAEDRHAAEILRTRNEELEKLVNLEES